MNGTQKLKIMNKIISDDKFLLLYDKSELQYQKRRYNDLLEKFIIKYKEQPPYFFSSPGRTEIAGNHTDHNNGKVIAAAVSLDTIAAVKKNNSNVVNLFSENLNQFVVVDLKNLNKRKNEIGKTNSLIRGIANAFVKKNYMIGGFDAYIKSDVIIGSGLSSSASFEILISKIFSYLFNKNKIQKVNLAITSRYSENEYFGKPCGLMDQLTCALGGTILIDFKESDNPKYKSLNLNLNKYGYKLLIVDTGGSHSDLTNDYSSIPFEMKSVAKFFNRDSLRNVNVDLLKYIHQIRKQTGDRAILRSLHFINENKRVDIIKSAITNYNIKKFLEMINKSGDSSFKYLQNIYSISNPKEQNISLALALTEMFFEKHNIFAASRVHGGGFAGTIQIILPIKYVSRFTKNIENYFGKNSVKQINIRNYGAVCLSEL